MLSVVGLALDAVGATAFVAVLFGHARGLYPGWSIRSPDDVARYTGFATIGLLFLPAGFVLQALAYVGVSVDASEQASLIAGLVTLGGASLLAFVLFGVVYLYVQPLEVARVKKEDPDSTYPRRAFRFGFRFWRGEAKM